MAKGKKKRRRIWLGREIVKKEKKKSRKVVREKSTEVDGEKTEMFPATVKGKMTPREIGNSGRKWDTNYFIGCVLTI